jgi:acetyl esterase/lipase
MIRHIGNFTQYLTAHAEEYNVNLDSVFVSGCSAGGHLTCAVALAIASGNYTSNFGDNLTIKGYIPFYPANGPTGPFADNSSIELVNPDDYLVSSDSPPCLVFQGLQDGLVHPSVAQDLKDAYTSQGNSKCAIIYFPFAGHANDLYFSGHYNQVFLYYMERFMYLCNYDLIS